jgi:hypothetical protein
VPHELEVRLGQQVRDVRLLAGEEVVEADHVVGGGPPPPPPDRGNAIGWGTLSDRSNPPPRNV